MELGEPAPAPTAPLVRSVEMMTPCIQRALSTGFDYVEATPEVFSYYVTDGNSKHFVYGREGIKVILQGQEPAVRDLIAAQRKMI